MTRTLLLAGVAALVLPMAGSSQPARPSAPPRLEPVADTKLIMEGLADPNLKAVDRRLKGDPVDAEAWKLVRGQSLLLAETANLLMIRPPKGARAEELWMSRATDLREAAATLARSAAAKDLARSRQALAGVAATCNKCHETFRVEVRVQLTDEVK